MILDARRTLGPGNASIALRHGADPDVPPIPLSASMRRCRRDKCRAVSPETAWHCATSNGGFQNAAVRKGCRSFAWWWAAAGSTVVAARRAFRATRRFRPTTIASPSKPKNENDDTIRSRPRGSIDWKPGGSVDYRRSDAIVEAAGRAPSGRGGWVWEGGGGTRPSFPWVGVFEGGGARPFPFMG